MLTELSIRNFAIIDQLRVEFGPGLNALTGETGAGKSILVDALNLLLGSRVSPDMIRTGQEEAAVEGFFDFAGDPKPPRLEEAIDGGAEGAQIRRIIQRSGKSRALINGHTSTLHMLEEFGAEMINIYGQHEHQQFLDPGRHIEILDRSGSLLALRREYQEVYHAWTKASGELQERMTRKKERSDRMELLFFQSQEIGRADLKPDEEQELGAERLRLVNAEKLKAITHQGEEILYGESGSVVERLQSTLQRLREGARIDPALSPFATALEAALFQAEDVASSLRDYQVTIPFDPGRLEAIESRLDEIHKLKRKYGRSIQEILDHKEKIDEERRGLDNLEEEIAALKKKAEELHRRAVALAQTLSEGRREAARTLSAKMEGELATLGMKKVRFAIQVGAASGDDPGPSPRLNEKGIDRVEFFISPNPGEELKPLARIASGGELSRTMLAFKRIFAEETSVKTLVFDEVDAGIGGAVAEVVGRKLKELSRQHQVFCITHLPQIAALADAHYRIAKKVHGGRTIVEMKRLDGKDREEEIARMLAGVKITEKTLDHAREMLQNSKNAAKSKE